MKLQKRLSIVLVFAIVLSLAPSFGFAALTEPATAEPQAEQEATSWASLTPVQIPGTVNIAHATGTGAAANPYGIIVSSPRTFDGTEMNMVNGIFPEQSRAQSYWDSWGRENEFGTAANRYYVTISWPEEVTLYGISVSWYIGITGDTLLPRNAFVEFSNDILTGAALEQFPGTGRNHAGRIAQSARLANDLTWHRLGPVGVEAEGNREPFIQNFLWNNVEFAQPIRARHIRLSVEADTEDGLTPGFGITLFNAYGYRNPAQGDLAYMGANMLLNLISDASLPLTGPNNSTITWSGSTAEAALANDGTVVRPERGSPNVTGTITATAVNGEFTFSRNFNFSVLAIPGTDDLNAAQQALAGINLGDISDRRANFNFPAGTPAGVEFSWETDAEYIWADGTVLRPPLGRDDAAVTVTATAKFGEAEATREWVVNVPAIIDDLRPIVSAANPSINTPVGTAPRLPNYLEVTYSDGASEMRRIQWDGHSAAAQNAQIERPVGDRYVMTGNVIGGGGGFGFPVYANITVVADPDPVPSNIPTVRALPWSSVVIDRDPDGQANVLTNNRDGHIQFVLNNFDTVGGTGVNAGTQVFTRYLHPFRTAYGLSTAGYHTTAGWNGKLRGHGSGHFITALALAYESPLTGPQRTTIVTMMERMVRELREVQLMTMYVPHPLAGQLNPATGLVEPEDRIWEARDFKGCIDLDGTLFRDAGGVVRDGDWRVMNMSLVMTDLMAYATAPDGGPRTYGHGYLNAIPAQHLIGNEKYAAYNDAGDGVWAPYYSHHKILQGLVDIYTVLDGEVGEYTVGGRTFTLQSIADTALQAASDMGLWIENRMTHRTRAGIRPYPGQPGRDRPGYRDTAWAMYIAGEFGGVNETLARLALITGDERHLIAAEAFWHDGYSVDTAGLPFMTALATNRDPLRTLHANTHIPMVNGTLWTYRVNNNPDYWNVAENFWEFNVGRYYWTIGNVKGNPTHVEKYVGAYNQVSALMFHNGAAETCAAYNLMKLSKYMFEHNQDAKYMDFFERTFVNQMVGSHVQGSITNQGTYHYPIHLNASKGRGNRVNIDGTCCAGTGAENQIKYQDAIYFGCVNGDAFYVGLYLPSTAKWAAQDVVIRQECVFPSDRSTFRVTTGAETGQFEMKFRVPYWVNDDFDITLNGNSLKSLQPGGVFTPSSYATTGVREWSDTDVVVVDMPFGFWVDYLPGKWQGNWVGSLMYGPLVMAATTAAVVINGVNRPSQSALNNNNLRHVTIDPFMRTGEGTDVTLNGRQTLGSGGVPGATALTRNVPTLTARVSGIERLFLPHYWVNTNHTTYLFIHTGADNWFPEKATLFNDLQLGRGAVDSGLFTPESSAVLAAALAREAELYDSNDATDAGVRAAIARLVAAFGQLEAIGDVDVAELAALVADANALLAEAILYTTNSADALSAAVAIAEAALEAGAFTGGDLLVAVRDLSNAIDGLVRVADVDRSRLASLLEEANLEVNPPILEGEQEFPEHEFQLYTRRSWGAFLPVRAEANDIFNNVGRNFDQAEVNAVIERLTVSLASLLAYELCDEHDALIEALAAARAVVLDPPPNYDPEAFANLLEAIETGDERMTYASLTFREMHSVAEAIREAIDALAVVEINFLRLNLNAITRVARNSTLADIGITVNAGARSQDVVLTVSNAAMASIGDDGRSVVTLGRAGTVTLTATDPESRIRHSVTLMIT